MTDDELREVLKGGEGPWCEFKASPAADEIRKAVVAFANSVRAPRVGVLLLGVNPDGTPSGRIVDTDKTQRDVMRYLEACYPPIVGVQLFPLALGDQRIIGVTVPESRSGPHFTGPAYMRVGSESRKASPEIFDDLVADRLEPVRRLRAWIGKDLHVQLEYEDGRGRRAWPRKPDLMGLLKVDAVGVVLYYHQRPRADGQQREIPPVRAEWRRVHLQPIISGQPPLIRIAFD